MARRIKILHLTTDSNLGGAEHLLYWLTRNHDRARWELVIGTVRPGGKLQSLVREQGVRAFSLDMAKPWMFPAAAWRLRRIVKQERPDIVHTHLLMAGLLGWCVSLTQPRIPCIHTRHYADMFGAGPRRLRWLDGWLMRRYSAIVAISKTVEKFLLDRLGISAHRVRRIYNGVDLKWLEDSPAPANALASSFHPLAQKGDALAPVIGVVGGVQSFKGQDVVLAAAPAIWERWPKARFFIVGEGLLRAELEQRVSAAGWGEKFFFTGFLPSIAPVIRGLDVLIVPSRSEGFGLVACEAMALHVPVLASRVEALAEIIEEGETGWLFESGNPRDLARAFAALWGNPQECARRCQKAARAVREHFTIERMTAELDTFYRDILHRAPAEPAPS